MKFKLANLILPFLLVYGSIRNQGFLVKFIIEISSTDLVPPRKRKYPPSEISRKYTWTRRRRNLSDHLINDPPVNGETDVRGRRKEGGSDLSYDYTFGYVIVRYLH